MEKVIQLGAAASLDVKVAAGIISLSETGTAPNAGIGAAETVTVQVDAGQLLLKIVAALDSKTSGLVKSAIDSGAAFLIEELKKL